MLLISDTYLKTRLDMLGLRIMYINDPLPMSSPLIEIDSTMQAIFSVAYGCGYINPSKEEEIKIDYEDEIKESLMGEDESGMEQQIVSIEDDDGELLSEFTRDLDDVLTDDSDDKTDSKDEIKEKFICLKCFNDDEDCNYCNLDTSGGDDDVND